MKYIKAFTLTMNYIIKPQIHNKSTKREKGADLNYNLNQLLL